MSIPTRVRLAMEALRRERFIWALDGAELHDVSKRFRKRGRYVLLRKCDDCEWNHRDEPGYEPQLFLDLGCMAILPAVEEVLRAYRVEFTVPGPVLPEPEPGDVVSHEWLEWKRGGLSLVITMSTPEP